MTLTLKEYSQRFNRSLSAIAKAGDIDRGDIYRIASGKRGCGPETAAKISKATDGYVTANDLQKVRLGWLARGSRRRKRVARPAKPRKSKADARREAVNV